MNKRFFVISVACLFAYFISSTATFALSQETETTSVNTTKERFYESNINYHNIIPKITYKGNRSISVVVRDQRPYVLSGQTGPEYVGIFRGGFGRPYDLGTSTLKPLAYEFSQFIMSGFMAAGFKTNDSATPDRIVSIDILEWLSVSGSSFLSLTFGTDLHYSLVVRVTDGKDNVLTNQEVKGTDTLGGNFSQIYELIPRGTENLFNRILNSPNFRLALTE